MVIMRVMAGPCLIGVPHRDIHPDRDIYLSSDLSTEGRCSQRCHAPRKQGASIILRRIPIGTAHPLYGLVEHEQNTTEHAEYRDRAEPLGVARTVLSAMEILRANGDPARRRF